nr:DNA polymerase III subunit [Desulfobacula sp.]
MGIDQTASDFDQMQYQSEAFLELTHIIRTKTIPNALLFYGHENTGRKEAALMFAKSCNCNGGSGLFCGACTPCRKIDSNSHPDMIMIDPLAGKQGITVSLIRELARVLSSRPNEAKYRMVLISKADSMNVQAQNALLKMLEEPPENTFFILMAVKIDLLLPTIISRCRKIRFKPLSGKIIAKRLVSEFHTEPELAHIVSETLDSDFSKILACLNTDIEKDGFNWIKKRKWLINGLIDILRTGSDASKGLMLSQALSRDPGFIHDALSIMKTFFRDLMIFHILPEKIVNLDFFDSFSHISQTGHKDRYFEWLTCLYESEKKIEANCTLRLILDGFFLRIAGNKREVCV